jgi:NPCBM/NEW2 domain
MSIRFRCPFCRSVLTLEDAAGSRTTTCGVCKKKLVISKASAPPIQPAPPTGVTAVLPADSVVPPSVVPVAGIPPSPGDCRHDDEEIFDASRHRSRRPSRAIVRQTPVVVGVILFVLLCFVTCVRLLVFTSRWETDHPQGPGRILPRMEGNWVSDADRIDIGGSENVDNRGHTKFILRHDGKLVSGVLDYQGDQTGFDWMKTIKPQEEEIWRYHFDKTVGQLKHDPREDTLTVTVDGKTQVFHRKPAGGQQEPDLADALLDEPLAANEQPDPPAKSPFAVDPKLLEGKGKVYLSDLKEFAFKPGWGGWGFGKNGMTAATPGWGRAGTVDEPMRVKGTVSQKGLSMFPIQTAYTRVCYALGKKATSLSGAVAFLDKDGGVSPVRFVVLGDGKVLWRSSVIRARGVVEKFAVDVARVDTLELRVYVQRGDGNGSQAIWLDPYVTTE